MVCKLGKSKVFVIRASVCALETFVLGVSTCVWCIQKGVRKCILESMIKCLFAVKETCVGV